MTTARAKNVNLTKEEKRDIRNFDELLSLHRNEMIPDAKLASDFWVFFRRLRVRLDNAGDTTKAWEKIHPRKKSTRKVK